MQALRIHHVITELTIGGAESLLCLLASQQLATGHNVVVHALSAVGPSARRLEELGVTVVPHRPRHPLSAVLYLARIFRRDHPDVIHCHNIGPALLVAPAARLASVPAVIVTRHGGSLGSNSIERKFWLAARLCNKVVAVSRSAAQRFASAPWACPEKITVILNGAARPEPGPPETLQPRSPGLLRLISVARLNPIKDFPSLLRAVALALPSLPGLHLWIVGDGAERTRLHNLINELGLAARVELLGDRTDVGHWLAQADLFVLSSVSEGIPVALLEAMAMGLPSIVTAVGGMPEVIGCCGAGVLVPPRDPQALASALLDLASDQERRQQLGSVARRCHEQHFSAQRMADEYLRLYHSCLGSRLGSACPRPL